jgi:hypothetical protein
LADVAFAAGNDFEMKYGDEVKLGPASLVTGLTAVGEIKPGVMALCRQVAHLDIAHHLITAGDMFGATQAVADGAKEEQEVALDDARTLWSDIDETTGKRLKEFKKAVGESRQEPLPDADIIGKRDALHVCHNIVRSGGHPMQYLENWIQKKNIGENDRNYHELESLLQILEDAACHDQLNLGGNLFVETLTRRVTSMIEALSRGTQQANWSQAREIMGREKYDSLMSAERRAEVNRQTKDRLEIEALKYRSSQQWTTEPPPLRETSALAATSSGGLPSASPDTPEPKGLGKRAKARAKKGAANQNGSGGGY